MSGFLYFHLVARTWCSWLIAILTYGPHADDDVDENDNDNVNANDYEAGLRALVLICKIE